jgi:group I intron endonuclease
MISKTYIYTLSDHNGNVRYVGKSDNPKKRLWTHISESKKGFDNYKHRWMRGLLKNENFPILDIIDEVFVDDWRFWESYWIEQFKAWGFKLTNSTKGGDGGDTYNNLTESKKKEFREKTSKLHKGRKRSKETCKNIKLAKTGDKNPMYKKEFSNEHKDKISKSLNEFYSTNKNVNKGKKLSQETKELISKNNAKYWLGKKLSKEQVSKMSKKILQYTMDGVFVKEWDSIAEAQRTLGLSKISRVCNGKSKHSGKFIWKFLEISNLTTTSLNGYDNIYDL